MFKFRNIDSFTAGRFERMGMLKGKRWYINTEDLDEDFRAVSVLFKPKRKEYGDKKVYCANHYGELVGYLLAIGSRTQSCKVELAHLSKYYENIHKERNSGTPEAKDGCIIYSHLERTQMLEHGKVCVDNYIAENHGAFENCRSDINDDINVCIKAIESSTRNFYEKSEIKRTPEYIEEKVQENRKKAINMIIYDCLYGNNDRHDENWALVKDSEGRDISLYHLYDNERVLGLYENIRTIQSALDNDSIEKDSEKILFSRMKVPGEGKVGSSYKKVLTYILNNYLEAEELLTIHLKGNTPRNVRMYLESCENLPEEYVTFGSKMYESRFEFAKELLQQKNRKETQEKGLKELGEDSILESR